MLDKFTTTTTSTTHEQTNESRSVLVRLQLARVTCLIKLALPFVVAVVVWKSGKVDLRISFLSFVRLFVCSFVVSLLVDN